MHLAMPQANGNSLRWAVPQATPPRRRARPCHALAQPVLDVASAPVLVFMIGRAVTAGILFYCTAQWWSTRQLRMQVEEARDNFNDREATRLKKLARLTGVKDSADDSKSEAK
eukprot:jgi/Astpho2/6753/Aster-06768